MTPVRCYSVYILASKSRVLYVGLTDNLRKRLFEHRTGHFEEFTKRYRVNGLVYFETIHDRDTAENREKYLKGLTRAKKIALIEAKNPLWDDLAEEWFRNPKTWLL